MPHRCQFSVAPAPGGESFGMEELGEPVYKVRLLPGGGVAKLNPGDNPYPVEVQVPGEPKYPTAQPPAVPPVAPLPHA